MGFLETVLKEFLSEFKYDLVSKLIRDSLDSKEVSMSCPERKIDFRFKSNDYEIFGVVFEITCTFKKDTRRKLFGADEIDMVAPWARSVIKEMRLPSGYS